MTKIEKQSKVKVAALITTCNRQNLLHLRALPSVRRQTTRPDIVIIVNDGEKWSKDEVQFIRTELNEFDLRLLQTQHPLSGAATAWNIGISHLENETSTAFIAILDDDDEWESDHIESNLFTASKTNANIVISGLQMLINGILSPRSLTSNLCVSDFLTGNPGWQGSNTFVSLDLLKLAGGFDERFQSLNDRVLAIRLLSLPQARVAYTNKWTAKWHCGTPSSLSRPNSPAKLQGLKQFYTTYRKTMSEPEKVAFFDRAQTLFNINKNEIHE